MQTKMLETLEAKIDDVHDHVTNVNSKLKTTLDEARKSDKICMVSFYCFYDKFCTSDHSPSSTLLIADFLDDRSE